MTREEIKRLVDEVKADVIAWRRHLHAHPELSFQEEKTAQFVFETLQSFGHLELSRPTKTSVMARLVGKQPGRVVAIRADVDALPIQEENTFEFASKHPGVMHACGHDGHTAMLLGTVKIFPSCAMPSAARFAFCSNMRKNCSRAGRKRWCKRASWTGSMLSSARIFGRRWSAEKSALCTDR